MAEIKRIVTPDPDGGADKIQYVWRYRDADGSWRRAQAKTKKALEAKRAKVLARVETGQARGQRPVGTVGDIADRWLEACERGRDGRPPLERSTLHRYRQQVDQHIKAAPYGSGRHALGDVALAVIDRPGLFTLRDGLIADLGREEARRVWTILRSVFDHAVAMEVLQGSPMGDMKIRADTRRDAAARAHMDDPVPTRDDIQAMLAAAREKAFAQSKTVSNAWRKYHVLFAMAAMTGLRSSELRGLMESDIDFEARTLTVNRRADRWGFLGPCKSTNAFRTIELPAVAIALLKDYLAWRTYVDADLRHDFGDRWRPGRLVFQGRTGHPLTASNIWRDAWKPVQIAAGVMQPDGERRFSFHSLRHFYASSMIAQGVSPKELQTMLGHSSIQMTFDTYGHLFPDDDGVRRRKLDQAARNLVQGVA